MISLHRSLAALAFLAAAILPLPVLGESAAGPPVAFSLPVDCAMGRACVIQNYVDRVPGPAAGDLRCGHLTYDGHDGTDIRVATLAEMAAGIPVVAAAPGRVKALRDAMPDRFLDEMDPEQLADREAGNGVVIDHGGGWETQYSHLQRGSIQVRQGQEVTAGTVLGTIGLSGRTEFPHVEFTVRHEGTPVDPFTGAPPESGCGEATASGAGPGPGLWAPETRARLPYQAGGLLKTGFAAGAVTLRAVVGARLTDKAPSRDSGALVFWALSFGLQKGDTETIRLHAPNGEVLAEARKTVPGDKAQWLRFTGRRAPEGGWPPGTYEGRYIVTRETGDARHTVIDTRRRFHLEP